MHLVNVGIIANSEFLLNEKQGAEFCCSSAEPSLACNWGTSFLDAESFGIDAPHLTLKGSK